MSIRHVLIVDDSKTELLHLSGILKQAGYVVDTAESGEEMKLHLKRARPDLILMDVVMPGKNGFHLTRALSRDPRFSDIPVIMCTSKGLETDRIWGMRQGARGYLVKPVDKAELLRQIRALE